MSHLVTNLEEARSVLEYFNGFHDGFIKKLVLISPDEFKDRGHQACSGDLTLEITFAHYNYQGDNRPFNQMVQGKFHRVKELSIAFSGFSYEWSINSLAISQATRPNEAGGVEKCLKAVITQPRLVDGKWELNEDFSFTFLEAEFAET